METLNEIQALTKDLSILYVEDSEFVRIPTMHLLSQLFKEIHVANDGHEGLEFYKNSHKPIDLVLTDIQTPRMTGLQMAKEIKQLNDQQHILIFSGYNSPENYAEAIEIGVEGFILKPMEREKFLKVIAKAARAIKNQKFQENYQLEIEKLLSERTSELDKLLGTDEITGLPNKTRLYFELGKCGSCSLVLVNIDNFDHINSTYGFEIGDKVLYGVARYLEKLVPERSTLYRLPSDEMAFLVPGSDRQKIEDFAGSILKGISHHRVAVDDIEMHITCTIGIALGGGRQMLTDAHIAMKEIREVGKNRYCVFDPGRSTLQSLQKNNIEWFRKIRKALESELVVPFFQPIVNNQTGRIEKYECLARIIENDRIITPNFFIDPARLVGMLPDITRMMISRSFASFAGRSDEFSVNITEYDLKDGYLIDFIRSQLEKHQIAPNRVVLEILENISAQGSEDALKQLTTLKEMGLKLALDDFGSEKSNFHRLQELNVDFIKIDGAFIKNLARNDNCYKITKTIKSMAESLEAKVIAEFVCDEEVFNKVKELGIEFSQGYYFGAPREKIE